MPNDDDLFDRRPKKPLAKEFKFWFFGTMIVVFIGYFLWLANAPKDTAPALDGFGCDNRETRGATLIVIDTSDPFTEYQLRRFNNAWKRLIESIPEQEFVAIAFVGETGAPPFRGCKPDDGKWGMIEGLLRPNDDPRDYKKAFENDFSNPIRQLVDDKRLGAQSGSSPILKTIGNAVGDLEHWWSEASSRRLIIFSDLLENDRRTFKYDNRRYRGGDIARVEERDGFPFIPASSLRKGRVEVFYLRRPRDNAYQGSLQKAFWERLFKRAGAGEVTFDDAPASDPRGGNSSDE